jgi:hypothetical protein
LDELAFSRFCSAIPKKNQQKEKRLNSFKMEPTNSSEIDFVVID